MSELGVTAGVTQVTVTADSQVAGRTLRMAGLPPGFLITSISRRGKVFFPAGGDTLEIGDHLTVIGGGFDLARIGSVTMSDPPV